MTEASEFAAIYKLGATAIPPNRPVVRDDADDLIFKTKKEKFAAVVDDIVSNHELGQPVLIGTISVEVSEMLATQLERRGIPHEVLNAKNHAREAEIIARAGEHGAVTIATNMAGRGVDIKLGEGVVDLGGLYVLGTERHESRRIDNQLRGRSGRQGDPGLTRFYLSAEDDVIRLFSGDRMYKILDRLGPQDGEPIQHKWLSRTIANAQKKVEDIHFQQRKRVLEYDDVMNKQREVIYRQRRRVLEGEDLGDEVRVRIDDVLAHVVTLHVQSDFVEEWDLDGLFKALSGYYPVSLREKDLDLDTINVNELIERVQEDARGVYDAREAEYGAEIMRQVERYVLLQVLDPKWREHLYDLDYLREGIHLRGFAQKDPLVEYKAESYELFQELMGSIWDEVVRYLFHVRITVEAPPETRAPSPGVRGVRYSGPIDPVQGAEALAGVAGANGNVERLMAAEEAAYEEPGAITSTPVVPQRRVAGQVGRNDPCPCGSGKKYKRCHGAAAAV
jgi:preprotein translocase subunit SecA